MTPISGAFASYIKHTYSVYSAIKDLGHALNAAPEPPMDSPYRRVWGAAQQVVGSVQFLLGRDEFAGLLDELGFSKDELN